ncbi:hypothetical protein M8J76_002643 [Diaphorina citri]|nr:hypothetical protein M8J76_002643 [Diaphorina citri]
MNFNPNNFGLKLDTFGDSIATREARNKHIAKVISKASSSSLRKCLQSVGLITVGLKRDLQLRLCRFLSQNILEEDKDPHFCGSYFVSTVTQDTLENLLESDTEDAEHTPEDTLGSLGLNVENLQLSDLRDRNSESFGDLSSIPRADQTADIFSSLPVLNESSTLRPQDQGTLGNKNSTPLPKNIPIGGSVIKIHKMTPKINLTKFSGGNNEDFQEFLSLFDKFAKLNGWSNTEKLDYLVFYLEGSAQVCLRNFTQQGEKTWDQITAHLDARFGRNRTFDYSVDLQNLKLDVNSPVEEYIHNVEKFCTALGLAEDMKILHLIKGLPVSMIDKMDVLDNSTFQKAIDNIKRIQVGKKLQDERIRSSVLGQVKRDKSPDDSVKTLAKQVEVLTLQVQTLTSQNQPHHTSTGPRHFSRNHTRYHNQRSYGHNYNNNYKNNNNNNYSYNNSYRRNHNNNTRASGTTQNTRYFNNTYRGRHRGNSSFHRGGEENPKNNTYQKWGDSPKN